MRTGFLILSIFGISVSFAQPNRERLETALKSASFNEQFVVGINLVEDKFYSEALFVWQLMLDSAPDNHNLQFKAGMCQVELNKELEALKYFKAAEKGVKNNYNPYSPFEKGAPNELYYYLAKSNHVHGQIDTALSQYKHFLDNYKKNHSHYKAAKAGYAQCLVAKQLMAYPKPYIITNLSGKINTAAPEYSPVVTIDGSALFFTSKRLRPDSTNKRYINIANGQYYEDIYVSYPGEDGDWVEPEYLRFCSVRKNDASIGTSPDGQQVLVYQDIQNGDIYFSALEDTAFGSLSTYPANELNSEFFEPHATVSADQEYIYFTSDRPGGLGGLDIWRLKRLPDGSWSKAFNLGAPINTEFDEDSPFLGADNKTLYFSSNGEGSMGGFDIMVSRMTEDGKWKDPENMGYPLNSVDDDIYYTTTASGIVGFFASDRLDGAGDEDIYRIETEFSYISNVAIFTGFILTPDGSTIPNKITIHVKDLTDQSTEKLFRPRLRDGGYVLTFKPCHTYQIDYRLESKSFYTTEVFVPCNASYQEIKHELLLDLVEMSATTINTSLPEDQSRWEFENSDYFPQLEGSKIKIYEKDIIVHEAFVNKYGQFQYKELDADKNYLMRLEEESFTFCEELVLNLVDSNNKVLDTYTFKSNCETESHVSEFSDILTTPIFQYNYGYDKDDFNVKNEDLKEYVRGIKQLLDAGKEVEIYVTSSASKVPTKKFDSNLDLAKNRMEVGIKTMKKLLKSNKIDLSKVTMIEDGAHVGGPDYREDAQKNADVYARYQFIKFEVRL